MFLLMMCWSTAGPRGQSSAYQATKHVDPLNYAPTGYKTSFHTHTPMHIYIELYDWKVLMYFTM